MSDAVQTLIAAFKKDGWDSQPYLSAMEICHGRPEAVAQLLHRGIEEIPDGATFLDDSSLHLSLSEWPRVIEHALQKLEDGAGKQRAALSLIHAASDQCPELLHPHLRKLFTIAMTSAVQNSFTPQKAWRESCALDFEALAREILGGKSARQRLARAALLESRHIPNLEWLIKTPWWEREMRLRMSREESVELWTQRYLHTCGFENHHKDGLKQLYPACVNHLCFEKDYFNQDGKPFWLKHENYPTWQFKLRDEQPVRFGGAGNGVCRECGGGLHHLISLKENLRFLGVRSLQALEISTCLSCLGWEKEMLFYTHDTQGSPSPLSDGDGKVKPQFPVGPLKETFVVPVDAGPRWTWQSWNSRQNLNRIGGHPIWVQDAQYPDCPRCKKTMNFLLQLDSGLPLATGTDWLWGSGGIGYVFWCDPCKVSGIHWQCT